MEPPSGFGIKPGMKLLGLNDKSKAALRNSLLQVKFLIIDELSIISSGLWTDIYKIYNDVEKLLKTRSAHESDEN